MNLRWASLCVGAVASACGGGGAVDGEAEHCELFTQGHADVYVRHAGESLELSLLASLGDESTETTSHAPEQVCIVVSAERRRVIEASGGRPEPEPWAPIGVAAGAAFWQLPAVATPGVPWLGISIDPDPASNDDAAVDLTATSVEAPGSGAFSSYVTNAVGAPAFLISTVTSQLAMQQAMGTHTHMAWTFETAGEWSIVFEAQAIHDPTLVSAPARFRFLVEEQ